MGQRLPDTAVVVSSSKRKRREWRVRGRGEGRKRRRRRGGTVRRFIAYFSILCAAGNVFSLFINA